MKLTDIGDLGLKVLCSFDPTILYAPFRGTACWTNSYSWCCYILGGESPVHLNTKAEQRSAREQHRDRFVCTQKTPKLAVLGLKHHRQSPVPSAKLKPQGSLYYSPLETDLKLRPNLPGARLMMSCYVKKKKNVELSGDLGGLH